MQRYISLKFRVLFFLIIGLAMPLTVMGYFFNHQQKVKLNAKAIEVQTQIAELLALSSSKPLWDLSPQALKPLLSSAIGSEEIVKIKVLDNKNEVFVESEDKASSSQLMFLEKPIVYENNVIGKICIKYSLEGVAAQQAKDQLFLILLFALQGLICGLILFYFISAQVLNPISKLKQQAQKIAVKLLNEPFVWKETDEIGVLGAAIDYTRASLRSIFVELERKNADLSNLNRNLEKKVVDRTATIRTILDHVKFGFLLIDGEFTVKNGYSKNCETLFGRTDIEGNHIAHLLNLKGDAFDALTFGINEVFEDSFIPAEIALDQLPKKFVLGEAIISMEGSPIRGQNGKVEKILFTFIDITTFEKIDKENRFNRSLVRIMHNIRSFQGFIAESKHRIMHARSACKIGDYGLVRMEIHTLKGNSAAFGMDEIVKLIHSIEEREIVDEEQIAQIQELFEKFLRDNYEMLKISLMDDEADMALTISKKEIETLSDESVKFNHLDDLKLFIKEWVHDSTKISIKEMLGPIQSYVERLAKELDRKVICKVSGDSLRLDPKRYKDVMQNLIHLLRNSVDHGIEPQGERAEKSPEGSLNLSFKQDHTDLLITVADDGRGIDVRRLVVKGLEKGVVTPEEAFSLREEDAINLIFKEGFSTSLSVSETSGRGVGMAAVKGAVDSVGGSIAVTSTFGRGTTVTIRVPLEVKAKLS